MASPKMDREAFMAEAGRRYDALLARAGGADKFDDIEEQALEAGEGLIRQLLAERLAAEARLDGARTAVCPECGQPMRRPAGEAGRRLKTRAGEVQYQRRHAICDRCRTSFSPSGPTAGDSGAGAVVPGAPGGV